MTDYPLLGIKEAVEKELVTRHTTADRVFYYTFDNREAVLQSIQHWPRERVVTVNDAGIPKLAILDAVAGESKHVSLAGVGERDSFGGGYIAYMLVGAYDANA